MRERFGLRIAPPSLADLAAGVSVALVALPQSLAYAELAGMPPVAGLWAIVPALLLAAPFLSAREVQVGPVATTSLLAFGTLSALAVPGTARWIALAALLALLVGAIRIGIGLVGWGRIAYLLSRPVRIGFLNAAAVLIAASQLPAALGVPAPQGVMRSAWGAIADPSAWDPAAIAFTVGTVVIVTIAARIHPLVPGVLIAVILALLVSRLGGYAGPVVGPIQEAWPRLQLDLPWEAIPRLTIGAVVLALVGFSEAASIGRDLASRARRPWSPDREFIAQGIANLGAGAFGGFPVGASFSRSAVGRLAGATSRWSGFVTGLTLLAALPLAHLLAPLPSAVLAAVILVALATLIRPLQMLSVMRDSRSQGMIAVATFVLTLALAPRIDEAVMIGVLLAIGQHLRREQHLRLEIRRENGTVRIAPIGVFWYGSAQRFDEAMPDLLSRHADADRLVVDLSGCGMVDWSAARAIREGLDQAAELGLQVAIERIPVHARRWTGSVWASVPTASGRATPPADDPPADAGPPRVRE